MYFDNNYVPDHYINLIVNLWNLMNKETLIYSDNIGIRKKLHASGISLGVITPGISWLIKNNLLSEVITRRDEETGEPEEPELHFTDPGLEIVHSILKNHDHKNISNADFFVSLDHNSKDFKEAVRSLSGLEEEVRKTNVEITADPADKLPISCEINNLKSLIEQPKVRVAAIFTAVQENSILRWLEVQTASGTIKALASEAIKFLLSLLPHK